MMPLRPLLDRARGAYETLEIRYLHPNLYIICIDLLFEGLDGDQRMAQFLGRLNVNVTDAESVFSASGVILYLLTPTERESEMSFIESAPSAHHWIEFLACANSAQGLSAPSGCKIIHFYGYKGGQARSTVLAMLSKAFADDGYRVLTVDADIEAPSLHRQFEAKVVRPDSTLLGCIQYGLPPVPHPVYVPRSSSSGSVHLLACKPSDASFDLDLAIFALNSTLNPNLLQAGFKTVIEIGQAYDVILIDHRSGLGSAVLPLVSAYPGPVLIFVRLDEQSDEANGYFEILLSQNPDMPGMFLSFSLDPEDSDKTLIGRDHGKIDTLLDILAKAISLGAQRPSEEDSSAAITGEDLRRYWLSWFHDRSFFSRVTPLVEGISADNRNTLSRIRELTELQSPKKVQSAPAPLIVTRKELTNSGNSDQGLLIQTEALRRLIVPNSPYTYVLGRKGTGKTRLLRTLAEQKLGVPLLVAEDFPDHEVILAADPILKDVADALGTDGAEKLWWVLLDAVAGAKAAARHSLTEWLGRIRQQGAGAISVTAISRRFEEGSDRRTFLIDGVETAFNSAQMGPFVEGLFRFLSSVQSTPQLAQKLTVRLFIRTDLVRKAVENVEQQIEGRSLNLSWDTQSILNFALARICELDWFRTKFADSTSLLESELSRLAEGAMPENECNEYLLAIFPAKLRRNNLLTLTFLKDYFSEGLGESASFYPRIYDTFLRSVADPSMMGGKAARMAQIEDGRVAQPLIIAAHDYASKEYLHQVAAELKNLVRLSDEAQQNQERVEALINAFTGLPTPFELERCLDHVETQLKLLFDIPRDRVRDSLQLMKQVGIFEDRPDYPGWWRAGRLFKNALGMKYVR